MIKENLSRRSFLTISAMTAACAALDWSKISASASKLGPKDRYPTVVIGAGLGGLSCAAHLAKQGIPVTVLEQHDIPGGYATSFDRAKGKFTFEVSLHGSSINNNATARILKDLGVLEKLKLVELPEVYHLKTPDFDFSAPSRDPQAFIRILSQRFPNEQEGIRGFVDEIIGVAEEGNRLHQKKGQFIKALFPVQYPRMWKIRDKTLAELLDDYVRDPALGQCLTALWGYYGLPPSKLSAFYFAVATGEYLQNGSFYIKPNSQALSNALVEVIEAYGGKVLFEKRVEAVQVKNGRVQGVSLADGKTLPARAVVGNASALKIFQEMLPPEAVPADYLKRLQHYRPSISTFIVWLGLNKALRGRIKGFGIHVLSGHSPDADYQSALEGRIDRGSFGVTIYNNLFADYSASGTSNVMLLFLCGYEPWRKFEADYQAGRKEAYHKEKERWTELLIKRAEERVIPGLSSMIDVREAATPLTNRRFTGNPGGAIYGFEQSMENAFMTRLQNRTPIKGLYLSSAWGNPGGGYAGVLRAGETAFQNMMEDWGKEDLGAEKS